MGCGAAGYVAFVFVADLHEKLAGATAKLEGITMLMEQAIATNATAAQDQDTYRQQFAALEERHTKAREEYEATQGEITKRENAAARLRAFQRTANKTNQAGAFNPATFHALADRIEVTPEGGMVVVFHDGRAR